MIIVSPNKSIRVNLKTGEKRVLIKDGTEITEDMLPQEEIDSYLKAGFLIDTRSAPPVLTPQKPDKKDFKPTSKWLFNPEDLEGNTLQELNLLIKERDASVDPYETTEEAIAHLSQDYGN